MSSLRQEVYDFFKERFKEKFLERLGDPLHFVEEPQGLNWWGYNKFWDDPGDFKIWFYMNQFDKVEVYVSFEQEIVARGTLSLSKIGDKELKHLIHTIPWRREP